MLGIHTAHAKAPNYKWVAVYFGRWGGITYKYWACSWVKHWRIYRLYKPQASLVLKTPTVRIEVFINSKLW